MMTLWFPRALLYTLWMFSEVAVPPSQLPCTLVSLRFSRRFRFVVVHFLPVCVLFSPGCFLFFVCLLFFFLTWQALLMSVTRSNSFFQPFPKNRVPLPQGSMPAFFSAEGAWVVEMALSHKHTSAWSPYVVTSSEVFHGVHSCVWLESCWEI